MQVKAIDPDLGRNGMVLYALQRASNKSSNISPLPFAVDAQSGQVMVVNSPLAEGRHALFIEASDQPANPSERRYSLAVVTIEVLREGSKGSLMFFVKSITYIDWYTDIPSCHATWLQGYSCLFQEEYVHVIKIINSSSQLHCF